MFKVNDRVTVLNETIKGIVTKINNQAIEIEDEDGFTRVYPAHKLAFQTKSRDYKIPDDLFSKDEEQKQPINPKSSKQINNTFVDKFKLDLHIEALVDRHYHLTNSEIVQIQLTACRNFVQESISQKRKKIILIHGKGEGVLKSEIRFYLERLSNDKGVKLDFHDASFSEFGIGGATEVILY